MICDNALLIVFSLSLKEVSKEIIDEVVKDFRLGDEARKKQEEHWGIEEHGGGDTAACAQTQPDVPQSPDSILISVAERQSS